MTQDKKQVPFGFWSSPITPRSLSTRKRISDAQWDTDGSTLVWLEHRSAQGVLVASSGTDAPRDLTDIHSVRARVGYGGGDFTVGQGDVIYANVQDGRLYQQALQGGPARALTPGFGSYAAPQLAPSGKRVLFVHTYEDTDRIGYIEREGTSWPISLAQGADFYAFPSWHPSGEKIAWIEWDHPNMPWDGTRLCLGHFSSEHQKLTQVEHLSGDSKTCIFQPCFSPDGRFLSYITTHNNLEALVLYNLEEGTSKILKEQAVLSVPAWIQGVRTHAWDASSQSIFYQVNDRGHLQLWRVQIETGAAQPINIGEYTWFDQLAVSPTNDQLSCIASSSTTPNRLITWSENDIKIVARTGTENIAVEAHSPAQQVEWKSKDGTTIHGLYYPPTSPHFWDDGLPPAIVNIHGGPTSQRVMNYSAEINFFTSRGFAVLEVNYRGSTGYGKSYMDALKENWGIHDVEDAVSAAKMLQEHKLADPNRLVIKGGSAGGYTVLKTVVDHPGVYNAGLCLFGVSNLFTLARGTHKFESRYLDSLIGALPQDGQRYRERSPLFKASNIQDPLAIFQGSDDKVVPPDQSEAIVAALKQNGVPHVYHLYEGEGHGWRKAETIEAYFNSVLEFLQEYVLYS